MAMTGANMRMPPNQKMTNLFQQIDTANTGSINKDQFMQAFNTMNPPKGFQQMGAENVWSKLDSGNSGSVAKQSFIDTMKTLMHQVRQQPVAPAAAPAPANISPSMDGINAMPGVTGQIIRTDA